MNAVFYQVTLFVIGVIAFALDQPCDVWLAASLVCAAIRAENRKKEGAA